MGVRSGGEGQGVGLLLGSLGVQEGAASVFGCAPGAPEVRVRLGAMLQISGVSANLTVREHIELFPHIIRHRFRPRACSPWPASRISPNAGTGSSPEVRSSG